MVGIVIPTMNRPDFVVRQLAYYADVGYRHTVYVGDSSESIHVEQVAQAVRRLQSRINIVHIRLPGLNDLQAVRELLYCVREPYAAFVGDDDFLAPASLDRCARFLDAHPECSTSHGVATLCGLGSSGAHGDVTWCGRYAQRPVEQASARERLTDYLGSYFVTLFSVHRTQAFRRDMDAAAPVPDKAFRELLSCCLSIVRGKAKELECLYLIRQAHDQRYLLPDVYDWITSPDWLPSYRIFCDCLVGELARQDGISIAEAQEVVKQAFWSYLGQGLVRKWQARYAQDGRGLASRWRELAKRVPGVRKAWHTIRSFPTSRGNEISLERLRNPSSPYHADFISIYRAVTTPPRD